MSPIELFQYWIREREAIRKERKLGGPPPWTEDPILQKYHFCNVRREHDRGTIERRALFVDSKEEDLPWLYTASNLFNYVPSIRAYMEGGAEAVKAQSGKIFHTAYVVSTCGKKMNKVDYCDEIIEEVEAIDRWNQAYCSEVYATLRMIPGLGSFLAGQIVADLKNDRFLADAWDWRKFSVMGPGSKKGLDYIFGPGTTEKTYDLRMEKLESLLAPDILDMRLHRQDLQNCLCEFSKYVRYKYKFPGRSRPYGAV